MSVSKKHISMSLGVVLAAVSPSEKEGARVKRTKRLEVIKKVVNQQRWCINCKDVYQCQK
jgi:hypothetical protein